MLLKNKVAIITGAGNGIGKGIAELFAIEGARVVVADIDFDAAKTLADDINANKRGSALAHRTDISKKVEILEMIKNTIDTFNRIDILVNNAGILRLSSILDHDEDAFDEVIKVNLKGTFLCLKYAAREMKKNGYGKIINISSNAAIHPNAGHIAYSASKAAINSMTRDAALELGEYGIRVNAIMPGMTDTKMTRSLHLTEETEELWKNKNCLHRLALPSDQAKAALFLASELSDHITGEAISVSAGEVMRQ